MLHNKYSDILSQFCDDYDKQLHGRSLLSKLPFSGKGIANALNELEKAGILTSQKKGALKLYMLNHKNEQIPRILSITETYRTIQFLEKQPALSHIFKSDERIVGVFGSYTRGNERKESDVDVFIIGSKKSHDYNEFAKILDIPIHIVYFSEKTFIDMLKKKKNFTNEIVINHRIIFGVEKFISLVLRYHHGVH